MIIFQNLLESNLSTELPTTSAATTATVMSSVPSRPASIAASVTSTASNKNQQLKQGKASASGEKTSLDTVSINEASEISK